MWITLHLFRLVFFFIKVRYQDDRNQRHEYGESVHWKRNVPAEFGDKLLVTGYAGSVAGLARTIAKIIEKILVD